MSREFCYLKELSFNSLIDLHSPHIYLDHFRAAIQPATGVLNLRWLFYHYGSVQLQSRSYELCKNPPRRHCLVFGNRLFAYNSVLHGADYQNGRMDSAEKFLQILSQRSVDGDEKVNSWLNLALYYLLRGDYETANNYYQKILSCKLPYIRVADAASLKYAQALRAHGKFDEANSIEAKLPDDVVKGKSLPMDGVVFHVEDTRN